MLNLLKGFSPSDFLDNWDYLHKRFNPISWVLFPEKNGNLCIGYILK
jgi:hypothetical protein